METMLPTKLTAPATSKEGRSPAGSASRSTIQPSARAAKQNGVLARNAASHPKTSTRNPIPTVPDMLPNAQLAVMTPIASPRRSAVNTCPATAGATAYRLPAPTP